MPFQVDLNHCKMGRDGCFATRLSKGVGGSNALGCVINWVRGGSLGVKITHMAE